MKISDLVTIIIPAHNAEEFLKENVESILGQTYKNIEVIYVCDGCTDNTIYILEQYAYDDRLIICVEKEKHGAAISRNLGMEMAKGEWIIFLDADDLFESDMIEKMIHYAVEMNADISCCYYNILNCADMTNQKVNNWKQKCLIDNYPVLTKKESEKYIFQVINNSPWNKLVKKNIIYPKNGERICFQDIPNCNDVFYSMVVSANAERIVFVDKNFVHYRSDGYKNNLSTYRNKEKTYILSAFNELFQYIDKTNRYGWKISFYNKILTEIRCMKEKMEKNVYDIVINELISRYWYEWGLEQIDLDSIYNLLDREFYMNLKINKTNIDFDLIKREKIVEIISKIKENCVKIAIWGAGEAGKKIVNIIAERNIEVEYVVDKDSNKWGMSICGYYVCDYEKIKNNVDVILVPNPIWYEEIVKTVNDNQKKVINLIAEIEIAVIR